MSSTRQGQGWHERGGSSEPDTTAACPPKQAGPHTWLRRLGQRQGHLGHRARGQALIAWVLATAQLAAQALPSRRRRIHGRLRRRLDSRIQLLSCCSCCPLCCIACLAAAGLLLPVDHLCQALLRLQLLLRIAQRLGRKLRHQWRMSAPAGVKAVGVNAVSFSRPAVSFSAAREEHRKVEAWARPCQLQSKPRPKSARNLQPPSAPVSAQRR